MNYKYPEYAVHFTIINEKKKYWTCQQMMSMTDVSNLKLDIKFPDAGVTGTVHVTASRCQDISLPGFQNVESTGCVDVGKTFDKDEWGAYADSTFTELTGEACTCEEAGCNKPQG